MSREGYKMTELGEIPQEWMPDTLGNCLSKIVGGGTPSRDNEQFYQGEIPWATVKDLDSRFYKDDTIEHVTLEAIQNSASNLISPGKIIVATRMGLGRGFINNVDMAINQDLKALFPKETIETRYLLHWFLNQSKSIESMGKGSTVKGIRLEELRALPISIPTFGEQQKIADILSTVDQQIEQIDALIEKTKELKNGLMQKLLTKGIGHTEFRDTEIGRIPKGWEVMQLAEVANINPNYKLNKGQVYDFVDMAALPTECLSIHEIKEREYGTNSGSKFKNGDTLFARITPCAENGKMAFVDCLNTEYGLGSTEFIVISPKEDSIYQMFLYYSMKSERIRNYAISKMLGTTGRQRIPNEVFKEELKVAVPSIAEQKKISECLYSIDKDIYKYEQRKAKFNELKKSLMQKLLSGKIRVKV